MSVRYEHAYLVVASVPPSLLTRVRWTGERVPYSFVSLQVSRSPP